MNAGRWHLYGTVVEGAGYSVQVLIGDDDITPFEPQPVMNTVDLLGGDRGPKLTLPLLGSWQQRPTIRQRNAVLAPGMEPDSQADNCNEYGDLLAGEDGGW